jgi:hypothetical protein
VVECWKVVIKHGPKYISRFAYGAAAVTYPIGDWAQAPEWLAAKGYGLCVLSSLEAARKLLAITGKGEVWRAWGEDEMAVPENQLALEQLAHRELVADCADWAPGMRMFRRVKLVCPDDAH